MKKWLRDVWLWLRGFPRPWRVVRIKGSILSDGGTVVVGEGVTMEVSGDICAKRDAHFVSGNAENRHGITPADAAKCSQGDSAEYVQRTTAERQRFIDENPERLNRWSSAYGVYVPEDWGCYMQSDRDCQPAR